MKHRNKILVSVLLGIIVTLIIPTTAYAIENPSSTPVLEDIRAWRNVLETGDMFVMLVENTPYDTTPTDYIYSEAFIWRFMDGSDDLGSALGYGYNDDGYGYNVIGFYWSESEAPAWTGNYTLKLSGNPSVFATPPEYNFPISSAAYSTLTDTDEVKDDISEVVINIADDFYSYWGLSYLTTLLSETETGTVLSLNGQAFFRGAIYGIQGMAPHAFPISITNFTITDRTWTNAYITTLEAQHAGNPIEEGMEAGMDLFEVDYNLMGLLVALVLTGLLIFGNWIIAGGQIWIGVLASIPVFVIGARMGLVGLGELGLIAAICMLYANARLWRMI